jgi:hypothetical protein
VCHQPAGAGGREFTASGIRFRKDGSPVKKLLALLVCFGLLGLVTGCPSTTTSKPPPKTDKDKDKTPPDKDKDKDLDKDKDKTPPDKDKDKAGKEKAGKEKKGKDKDKE